MESCITRGTAHLPLCQFRGGEVKDMGGEYQEEIGIKTWRKGGGGWRGGGGFAIPFTIADDIHRHLHFGTELLIRHAMDYELRWVFHPTVGSNKNNNNGRNDDDDDATIYR
jgi:hypothetical protein